MNSKSVSVFAVLILFSVPALAFHCPIDMKKIDAALAEGPSLEPAQLEEVKELRAEGDMLHIAGKHQQSVDALAKAMSILNIE